jgi:heptosyltransferase-2/heptosyltransferase-3
MKYRIRLFLLYALALFARPFVPRRSNAITRILYVKPDHLGDLLLATPVLSALRERFPTARITALVGPWSQMVLARNPDVDFLLTCPFPGFERRDSQSAEPRFGLSALVSKIKAALRPYTLLLRYAVLLRAGGYDLAIIGRDDHWWGAALAMIAGIPERVGYAVAECQPFLTKTLPWNPNAHVTAQGFVLVENADANRRLTQNQSPSLGNQQQTADNGQRTANSKHSAHFYPSAEDRAWASAWVGEHLESGEHLVIIHPGTGGPSKLWMDERWAAVADALGSQSKVQVVLTGGPDEKALVARIVEFMRSRPHVLAGKTTVGQLAALMGSAALVLGVDSGPLHLAAAMGTPTIHLYGPGDDKRFGPWGDTNRHHVLRSELWCSPCGVFAACPRGLDQPECMTLIHVEHVLTVAREQLPLPTD